MQKKFGEPQLKQIVLIRALHTNELENIIVRYRILRQRNYIYTFNDDVAFFRFAIPNLQCIEQLLTLLNSDEMKSQMYMPIKLLTACIILGRAGCMNTDAITLVRVL